MIKTRQKACINDNFYLGNTIHKNERIRAETSRRKGGTI